MTGEWVETTMTIGGVEIPSQPDPRSERIEQCGSRILIASGGVLHEVFQADSSMFNGVNDVDPTGQPVHFTGSFEDNVFILIPRIPGDTVPSPGITREIIQDDDGNEVLKLFNPIMGSTRYLRKGGTVSAQDLILANDFKVMPNPFQSQTLVTWNNKGNETFQATLLNLTGQIVRGYQNLKGESLLVEKGDLIPGIYFLRITDRVGNLGTVKLLVLE